MKFMNILQGQSPGFFLFQGNHFHRCLWWTLIGCWKSFSPLAAQSLLILCNFGAPPCLRMLKPTSHQPFPPSWVRAEEPLLNYIIEVRAHLLGPMALMIRCRTSSSQIFHFPQPQSAFFLVGKLGNFTDLALIFTFSRL